MDILLAVKAIIMGLVEGFTEFLPISSTGHLILMGSLLDFTGPKSVVFKIVIQAGAMLAVVWEYRDRIARVLKGLLAVVLVRGTRTAPLLEKLRAWIARNNGMVSAGLLLVVAVIQLGKALDGAF